MRIYDPAAAQADRPHYERLYGIFADAVKPQVRAEIAKFPEPPIRKRILGFIAGAVLAVISAVDRMRAGAAKGGRAVPKMSFEDEISLEYAHNLTNGWLNGMKLTKDSAGFVCEDAVFPRSTVLTEHWTQTQSYVQHFGSGIDLKEVVKKGLEALASTPGDVALPMGMTIKRSVLDAALIRAKGP